MLLELWPARRRADGTGDWLSTDGLPLGIEAGMACESGTLTLGTGDLRVGFTDGVVEAQDTRGEEYGGAWLAGLLKDTRQSSASETLARRTSSVGSFVGTAPRFDDITCLVQRDTASAPERSRRHE